jgi:hypothetical protein
VAEAHRDPRFTNTATYQVAVTVTIAGGARPRTAHRRAAKVAERIANAAARSKDVVDATAAYGLLSHDGEILLSRPAVFAAANTGHGSVDEPSKLSRYLDPDHERALISLQEANARSRERRDADRDRRREVGCHNAGRASWQMERWACGCVYCDPDFHLAVASEPTATRMEPLRCLCGRIATRCDEHTAVVVRLLDGDPAALRQLAALTSTEPLREVEG